MIETIKQTFEKMEKEIQKIKTEGIEPNRYHKTASVSEVNLVYHFSKELEKTTSKCAVYLEFPCDSGRVDAVILYENNILLIEAKSNMDTKKFKVLNAQATRFENINVNQKIDFNVESWIEKYFKDSSLRDTLKKRVYNFMSDKWKISGDINIYGVLLADTVSVNGTNKWNKEYIYKLYEDYKLNCMETYSFLEIIQVKNNDNAVSYLGWYKKIDILEDM